MSQTLLPNSEVSGLKGKKRSPAKGWGLGNPFRYRYRFFRGKVIQPFFWSLCFLSPVLNVFRVDMIHQQLVFMQRSYPFRFEYLMWLPIVFYGAVILIALVSFIWGRLFCGWVCPHNTLTEWTQGVRGMIGLAGQPLWMKRFTRRYPAVQRYFPFVSVVLALGITATLSLALSCYVVPPLWLVAQYQSGSPHIALVMGNMLLMLVGLFLLLAGTNFCRTCCPYGLAQSVSAYHEGSRWRPMEIAFTGRVETECKTCKACQSVCPVEIDPRAGTLTGHLAVGQFEGCFNCGECIDICKFIQTVKPNSGLLSFQPPGMRPPASQV
jgi:ferredoxin-type protein NapH